MAAKAKYLDIMDALQEQLAAGKYRVGDRVPSESHLAKQFSVSRPTAARALRELGTAGLLERRVGSGTYVGRTGREAASGGKTYGLLVQGLGRTEIFDPICTEITRVCQEGGATVLWGDASKPGDDTSEIERLCRYYQERQVDGVFFAPLEAPPDRERQNVHIAATLAEAGIAVVLLDRDILDFPGRSTFDLVGIDNFLAGMHLAQHLIDVGHRRLTFVARPNHPSTTDLRVAGCRTALQRAGVAVPSTFHQSGDPSDETFVSRVLADEKPDAVVCSNDLTAAHLVLTLAHQGMTVPTDLAVVGFDDVKYSTMLPVGLTTMRQPYHAIARVAVRAMNDRIQVPNLDPRQLQLSAELVVRGSSRPSGDVEIPQTLASNSALSRDRTTVTEKPRTNTVRRAQRARTTGVRSYGS